MSNYPIKPSDIKTTEHFWDAFGNSETEISARYLVRMAQANGSWRDFTKSEIDEFSKHKFSFNKLTYDPSMSPPIKENEDGTYSFTHKFIAQCFLSAPAITEIL